MRPRADRGRARRASSAAPSTLENGAPGGRFEAMASELWTLLVTGVATIAAVAAAHYVVKQNRARRLRVLAATNLFMQEAWNTVAAIPLPFLPLAVRVVLGKVMQVRLARALRYFPDNDRLHEHARRIGDLVSQADANADATIFDPTRRREIRRELMDVKRICTQAARAGTITEGERMMAAAVIDALGLRLLIDHLVDAAAAAEALGSFDEARALLLRAIEELSRVEGQNALVERTTLERRVQEVDAKLVAKHAIDVALKIDLPNPQRAPRNSRYE
jgi:hypothetical protein